MITIRIINNNIMLYLHVYSFIYHRHTSDVYYYILEFMHTLYWVYLYPASYTAIVLLSGIITILHSHLILWDIIHSWPWIWIRVIAFDFMSHMVCLVVQFVQFSPYYTAKVQIMTLHPVCIFTLLHYHIAKIYTDIMHLMLSFDFMHEYSDYCHLLWIMQIG